MFVNPKKVMKPEEYSLYRECLDNTFLSGFGSLKLLGTLYPKQDTNPLEINPEIDFACLQDFRDTSQVYRDNTGKPLIFLTKRLSVPRWSKTFCLQDGRSLTGCRFCGNTGVEKVLSHRSFCLSIDAEAKILKAEPYITDSKMPCSHCAVGDDFKDKWPESGTVFDITKYVRSNRADRQEAA